MKTDPIKQNLLVAIGLILAFYVVVSVAYTSVDFVRGVSGSIEATPDGPYCTVCNVIYVSPSEILVSLLFLIIYLAFEFVRAEGGKNA